MLRVAKGRFPSRSPLATAFVYARIVLRGGCWGYALFLRLKVDHAVHGIWGTQALRCAVFWDVENNSFVNGEDSNNNSRKSLIFCVQLLCDGENYYIIYKSIWDYSVEIILFVNRAEIVWK